MAENVTSEAAEAKIHEAFRALAKQCWKDYGLKVNSVRFDWLDLSSGAEIKFRVRQLSMDSTYTGYKP